MAKSASKHDKIVYPAGCRELSEDLGKDELIKRLKLLARSFQDMGQEENDQYTALALHIASDFFVEHQSKDIRLLVACCVADVFRIFAPEAPYKEPQQLKEIFMFLIQQLKGLDDPTSPSFKRYFYLLENLAWVKSFNICIELEDNQDIFCALFKLMFSIVSEKHSSKVRTFILDLMTPLICEADNVSQELLDLILVNLVDPKKSHNKVAYIMAKDLIRKTSNAIEPYIQAFFNNMLMLGKCSESDVSKHLYDLIFELNQIAPNVLFAVLPQLEFKLKSNEEHERKAVTKLLAKMFSEQNSDLALKNKPLWNCFLGRFNDICVYVRTTCVQSAQFFILYHSELMKDILEQLKVRQYDPEETVRMEVVNCMLQVARRDFTICTDEMLSFIKDRTLDKKFKVRREALLGLGGIYRSVMSRDPVDPQQAVRVDWIRNKVFHHYYQNSNDDRLLVERILNVHLVPYNLPVSERMGKLLKLYCTLDEHSVKAFSEMLKHRSSVRLILQQLLDAYDKQSALSPPPLYPRLASLARTLPEQQKPNDNIMKLSVSLRDDGRMRHLFRTLVSKDCTCKKAEDSVKEVLRKVGSPTGSNQPYYSLMKSLLERVAPVMIDDQAITDLVALVRELIVGSGPIAEMVENSSGKGIQLLLMLSHAYSHYFKTGLVYEDLLTFLKHDDDTICDCALQILVQTLHGVEDQFPDVYSNLIPLLTHLAKMGTPKQTKHALHCISIMCRNRETILSQVFEYVHRSLNPDSANYITSIVALGHLAHLCPSVFGAEMKNTVTKVIVKNLLMQDRTTGPDIDGTWCADHLVTEETQSKVQAMKLLVRWLLGLKGNVNNSATSTLRLLYTVIIHEGDLMEHRQLNKPDLARLRLQAGCCMLKLAEEACYVKIVTPEQFHALALLINDPCYFVRLRFALKLHKGLLSLRLPLEYMSIFSLAANDPLKERRTQVKQFLNANVQKRRDYLKQNANARGMMTSLLPDYVVPYTIHLLAHDPDFKCHDDTESLKNLKECLWFILEPLMGRAEDYNYSFLRHMIEKIKQTRDVQCPDDEETNNKLYVVCDLALGIMNLKPTTITLKDSNVEPPLPSKLFTKADKAYANMKSYLPKDFQFDMKRRFPPAVLGAGTRTTTTTEILVMSHAPIVNPLPKTPKHAKRPARERTLSKHPHQQPEVIEIENDDDDDDTDVTNNTAPLKSLTAEDDSASAHPDRRTTRSHSEVVNRGKSGAMETGPVGRIKVGIKQTKMDDFSPANQSKIEDGDVGLNNGISKESVRNGKRGGGLVSQKNRTGKVVGPTGKRRERKRNTDISNASATPTQKRSKVESPSTLTRRIALATRHKTRSSQETLRRDSRSPSYKANSPQVHPSPRRMALSLLRASDKQPRNNIGKVVAIARKSSRTGRLLHEDSLAAHAARTSRGKMGRRPRKVLPNGTSDGEDHSTQDSDSMRSNPGQQQDLTRALELQPTVDSSFSMGDADDDKLNSRRRAARPKRK